MEVFALRALRWLKKTLQFPKGASGASTPCHRNLTPGRTIRAITELYRVTSDKLWVTTPSMGVNDFGPPDGWP